MANRYPYQHPSFQPRTGGMGMPPVAMGLTTQQPGVDMASVSRFPGIVAGMWNQQGQVQSWIPPQQQRPTWEHQQKEREYLKQQQKLRAMSYSNKKSPVTADALIENLLGQKETFVLKKNDDAVHEKQITAPDGTLANGSTKSTIPDRKNMASHHSTAHQRVPSAKDSIAVNTRYEEKEKGPHPVAGSVLPGTNLPHWASGVSGVNLPPMYDRIWEAVACPLGTGLADTALLFPLLLTSGLQREVLGHIWALTNRTVPGRLTRPELNVTLALIALAQSGHSFCNLSVLEAVPHPILPNLDLSTLPVPKRASIEVPAPVSSLPICPATSRADLNAPITPSLSTPSSAAQENPKSVLDDDWDEFTEFQSASSSSLDAPADSITRQQTFLDSSTKSVSSNAFTPSGTSKIEKPALLNSDVQTPILPCIPLSIPSQGNRLLSAESSPVLSSRSSSEGRGIGSRLANHTLGAPKTVNQGFSSKSLVPSKEDDYDDFCEFRSGPLPSNNFENNSLKKFSGQENFTFDDLFPRCVVRPYKPEPLRESAIRAEPTCNDAVPSQKDKKVSDSKDDSLASVQTWMSGSDFPNNPPSIPKKEGGEEKPTESISEAKATITIAPAMSVDKDRYSALRALAAEISPAQDAPPKEDDDDEDDDDFGDFLSARGTPAAAASEDSFTEIAREGVLNKEGPKESADDPFNILGPVPTEPQPVNSTGWSADFSAFEEERPRRREINNNEAMPNNDDEFGDFVGGGSDDVMASLRIDSGWPGSDRRGEGSIGTGEASPDSRSINAVAVEGDGNGIGRARTGSLPSLDLKGFSVMGGGEGEGSSGEEGDGIASGEGRRTFCSSLAGEKFGLESWESVKSADRHAYEWRRCLASCLSLLQSALLIFSSISSGEVIEEVVSTEEGEDYLSNLLEVYWVSRRIAASYQQLDRRDSQLDNLLDDIGVVWDGLMPFYEKSGIMEMDDSLGLRGSDGVRKGEGNGSYCGVCLASVPGDVDGELSQGLSYGGHIYHTTCANLWVNCVDRLLPSLHHFSHAL